MAAGFAALGTFATSHTLGYALRGGDTRQALATNPGDARLKASRALALAQPTASAGDRAQASRLAHSALMRDPTAVAAVDALAVLKLLEGRERQGRDLFRYATILSRRDLQSQLWSIEDAVARGDVRRALLHYDTALRTSDQGTDLLFPVLSQAIAEAPIRTALIDRMAGRPLWSEAFISHAADKGPDFAAAAALFSGLQERGISPPGYARASLIGRLLEQGEYEAAWRYYASFTPRVDRRVSRDRTFEAMPADPTAFDWGTVNDAGVSASVQQGDGGGALIFSAAASVGGPMARQMQVLPAGRYTLDGESADIDQPRSSWPYWSLTCLDGREIGTVEVPASGLNGGRFTGEMEVPAGCPAQWLTLVARQSDGMAGLQGAIRTAGLRPAR